MSGLRRLLYISAAAGEIPDAEIADILAASRRNNSAAGVTGMLLHLDGGFLQVLEGPPEAVEATYDRIGHDKRHRGLILLWRADAEARGFADWSMGFERVRPDDPRWDGAFRIDVRDGARGLAPEAGPEILSLMQSFYDTSSRGRFV